MSESILNTTRHDDLVSRHGKNLFRDLVFLFKDYGPQVEALKTSLLDSDFEKCRFIAHKLKGASANLGAEKLSMSCEYFEQLGADLSSSREEALERLQALQSTFQQTVDQLDELIAN